MDTHPDVIGCMTAEARLDSLPDRNFLDEARSYQKRLQLAIELIPLKRVGHLAQALLSAWEDKRQVFILGNGGSSANANHIANDLIYGVSKKLGRGLRVNALSANSAVLTCLANDEGYESVYVRQLAVLANPGDVVIALSGSGNSPNVLSALKWSREHNVHSFAILGYYGGEAKALADCAIHVPVDDMQISEDIQLVVGHMVMQWLYMQKSSVS